MWYSEEKHQGIKENYRSIIVAFANLLDKYHQEITPEALAATLLQEGKAPTFNNLANDFENIEPTGTGDGWPVTSDSIVMFRRVDFKTAGLVDHYCLMIDHRARSIVDSLDGRIKPARTYGEPIEWASYRFITEDDELKEIEENLLATAKSSSEDKIYRVHREGENIWQVGEKLGISGADLISHNDLGKDPNIEGDTLLHLPIAVKKKVPVQEPEIRYEIFSEPKDMHVIADLGAYKYSFGFVRQWSDIARSGPSYPYGTNIKVFAVAHVPIPKESKVAAYYMDAISFGNFNTTGRVQHTTGFSHSQLRDGFLVEKPKVPRIEIKKRIEEAVKPKPEVKKEESPNVWKATQNPVTPNRIPLIYIAKEDILIHDYDNKRPSKMLLKNQQVTVYSLFEKDGITYGRPIQSVESGNWFGIPLHALYSENDLYSLEVDLEDRIAMNGNLTLVERYWIIPVSKMLSLQERAKKMFIKNKKNK